MPDDLYLYNITLMLNRAAERRRFTRKGHAAAVMEVLEHINETHAWIYAYVVMPDHIHILLGRHDKLDDVDKFAGRIKRMINKAFERRDLSKMRWLDGSVKYDVTLETIGQAKTHILGNPIRGQLVTKPEDWPYSGTPTSLPVGSEAPQTKARNGQAAPRPE